MTTDYEFIKTNAADIEADMIAMYESLTKTTVQPASPEKLFIQWVASVIVKAYVTMNYIGNQNIPSRASGANLDALGEMFYSLERPQAQPAVAVERFTLSAAQSQDIIVPKGTRVTDTSRSVFFHTTEEATVPAGQTTVDVPIICEEPGTLGNGFATGQLNTNVDVFEYYFSCANISETDGGADAATDAEYLALLKASQDAFSTAGPIGAYKYHALKVSTEISDIKVIRPLREIEKTLTVYGGCAFIGGAGLNVNTLEVDGGELETDYTVDYEDDLLTINIDEDGALADAETIDITIKSIDAGCIQIFALMADGSPASSTVKDLILAACNDETVRPLTDRVSVEDPEEVSYNLEFTYYRNEDIDATATEVETAVNAAAAEYIRWQSAKIGRDINPSKLIQLVMATGLVKRVEVNFEFTSLKDGSDHTAPQLAVCDEEILILDGGVEDD